MITAPFSAEIKNGGGGQGVGRNKKPQIDDYLTKIAFETVGEFQLSTQWLTAGTVACALRCETEKIYTGICIDLACGLGFCAEHSAVASMLKDRETRVLEIVAVTQDNIIPPCGRCREMLLQINTENKNTLVTVQNNIAVTLCELMPFHWMESYIKT